MSGVHPALEEIRERLSRELAGCSAGQLLRHPADDAARWNAWQVMEHLSISWQLTIRGLEDRLQKGRPLQTRPSLRQRGLQFVICGLGYFPPGRKAPAATLPSAEMPVPVSGDEMVTRMRSALNAMDRALSAMEPMAGDAPVLTHMVLGPMNVGQWRRFHRVHAGHHARQLRSLLHE